VVIVEDQQVFPALGQVMARDARDFAVRQLDSDGFEMAGGCEFGWLSQIGVESVGGVGGRDANAAIVRAEADVWPDGPVVAVETLLGPLGLIRP
jgi:hypothetical protein